MASITGNWDKTKPAGTDPVSEGDNRMRTHWGALDDTITEEHYFDDSSDSAGIHKLGSARVFYDVASNMSAASADDKGRLFYASDESSLYVLSDTTAIKVTTDLQLGGPVKSVKSGDKGWYISSYITAHKGPRSKYSFLNSSGNPTLIYDSVPAVLGTPAMQVSSSVTSFVQFMMHSITSSYVDGSLVNFSEPMKVSAGAGSAEFNAAQSTITGKVQISVMGLLDASLLS